MGQTNIAGKRKSPSGSTNRAIAVDQQSELDSQTVQPSSREHSVIDEQSLTRGEASTSDEHSFDMPHITIEIESPKQQQSTDEIARQKKTTDELMRIRAEIHVISSAVDLMKGNIKEWIVKHKKTRVENGVVVYDGMDSPEQTRRRKHSNQISRKITEHQWILQKCKTELDRIKQADEFADETENVRATTQMLWDDLMKVLDEMAVAMRKFG
jgi:hypothetical protein